MITLTLTLRRDNGVIECQSTIEIHKDKAPVGVFEIVLHAAEEAAKPAPLSGGAIE